MKFIKHKWSLLCRTLSVITNMLLHFQANTREITNLNVVCLTFTLIECILEPGLFSEELKTRQIGYKKAQCRRNSMMEARAFPESGVFQWLGLSGWIYKESWSVMMLITLIWWNLHRYFLSNFTRNLGHKNVKTHAETLHPFTKSGLVYLPSWI